LIITPSDHIIDDMEAYETAIQEAVEKAASQGYIVTLDCTYKAGNGIWIHERKGMIISLEKPNQVSARFIAKGNFLWNSGMFCFKAEFCWKN
jgi:mannose-1-phosphate guanylyltransferase